MTTMSIYTSEVSEHKQQHAWVCTVARSHNHHIKSHIKHWVSMSLTVDQEVRHLLFLNHLILLHVPCHSSFFNQSDHAQQLQRLERMPNHEDDLTWELTSSYITLWCSSLAFQQWLFLSLQPLKTAPPPFLPDCLKYLFSCHIPPTTVSKPYRNPGQQKVIGVLGIWPKIRTQNLLQIHVITKKTCLLNLHRPQTAPDSSLITRWDAAGNG